MTKAKRGALIQYANSLYSLNEDLFSVAQSLFAHMGVGQMQTHGFGQTNFRKPGVCP